MIEFREYPHGSPEYRLAIAMRLEILRRPLGLRFSAQELERETSDIHLGAFRGDELLATLTLTPGDGYTKMRQVAVADGMRRLGLGSQLVEFSEKVARAAGFEKIVLHARETVVPFYERLGYAVVGEPFEEVTIPHRSMEKSLVPTA